ncbi:MAG: nuclear transport factor 2 family protein [Rhodobacteraceae bacterium]|jgi:hypothetical protein|nr:nuclear transport factor 2 family protein [Paracoccaceae bacterium]
MTKTNLQHWHDYATTQNRAMLTAMLHDDAVFHSPVMHRPQEGKALTAAYLAAATEVLFPAGFRYLREFDCGDRAVLEFQCELDGITVNGVDMIEWDADGLITDFKVMVRPAKALQVLQQKMAEMLARMGKG